MRSVLLAILILSLTLGCSDDSATTTIPSGPIVAPIGAAGGTTPTGGGGTTGTGGAIGGSAGGFGGPDLGAGGIGGTSAGGTPVGGAGGGSPSAPSGGETSAGGTNGGGTDAGGSTGTGGSPGMNTGGAGGDVAGGGSAGDGAGGVTMMPAETEGFFFYLDNCDACHEFMGEGKPPDQGGPEVAHTDRGYARWVIRNGRSRPDFVQSMRGHPEDELPDNILEELLDYLDSIPQPTTPEGLYLDYCGNCHGLDAQGGITESDISVSSVEAYIASTRSGHNLGMYAERQLFMPQFGPEQLSDEEITAIHGYVMGL